MHFNSRPHGGRLSSRNRAEWSRYFNSRPHGGRRRSAKHSASHQYFNSRPHGGRRSCFHLLSVVKKFQLTPSRRATRWILWPRRHKCISTHALTEGDGQTYNLRGTLKGAFQLTPSQRATTYIVRRIRRSCISTHALTEGDSQQRIIFSQVTYFNSRPHGGRQGLFMAYVRNKKFQLTPSRRATAVKKAIIFFE